MRTLICPLFALGNRCHQSVDGDTVIAGGADNPRIYGFTDSRINDDGTTMTDVAAPSKASSAPKWEQEARDALKTSLRKFNKPLQDLVQRDANEGDTRLLVKHYWRSGQGEMLGRFQARCSCGWLTPWCDNHEYVANAGRARRKPTDMIA